jgi:hypothetical protein
MGRKYILVGLLMAVFLFSLFINVGEVEAEGFDCKGSKQAVRQCLKNVIK